MSHEARLRKLELVRPKDAPPAIVYHYGEREPESAEGQAVICRKGIEPGTGLVVVPDEYRQPDGRYFNDAGELITGPEFDSLEVTP